jgi:glyoxylase-like metal-dependent hydrolase (beta-lactamase superfamily II)
MPEVQLTDGALDCSIRALAQAYIVVPNDFCAGVQIHSNEGTTAIPMTIVLISYRDEDGRVRHIAVDAGVPEGPRPGGREPPSGWRSAADVLASVDLRPEDLDMLVLTHLHRDHTGAVREFTNARIAVQEEELRGWEEALSLPAEYTPLGAGSWIARSVDRGVLSELRGDLAERVTLLDGPGELFPGVFAHTSVGGHSFSLQWLEVRTPDGPIVIASDALMWYSNLEEMWPSGYGHGSTYKVLLTYGEIRACVDGAIERIVPGHDPRLYARRPGVSADGRLAELRVAGWDAARV